MMEEKSYRIALACALLFHIMVLVFLFSDKSSEHPVMELSEQKDTMEMQASAEKPEEQAIKAVSVDSKEVAQTMNRIKEERLQQQQAENRRQQALQQQAENARKQRLEEQLKLQKLKTEAAELALKRKKQIEEEKQHLQQVAKQKQEEEKRLAEVKKQQQEEAVKLAQLQKKKAEALAKAAEEKEALAKKAQEQKRQAAIEQARADALRNAKLSGEVDKYKAMIISAIGRQWILPENVDSSLSSQFRIRLAPNGSVLEVSLMRSSGDSILDRSAQSAIYKASPLPVPSDPQTFNLFRDISLTVRPESARG